jgi:hypothetical protein
MCGSRAGRLVDEASVTEAITAGQVQV